MNQQAIFITGGPGSGKGTQATMLAQKLGYLVIAGGQIARALAATNPEVKILIDKGELIDDELILRQIEKTLEENKNATGFIFDGIPRNAVQLPKIIEMLVKWGITNIICFYLNLPENIAIERTLDRKFCLECQLAYRPGELSYETNSCARCKTPLQIRTDDNAASISHRWQIYQTETAPILEYFRQNNRLVEIDGQPAPEIIFNTIVAKLNESKQS